jgi:phosphoribosyl 1,2-cyclic phosphodiesterase
MKVKFWGVRGSIPSPGPYTVRYGGNTPCVEVRTSQGDLIILDSGSGLRLLGMKLMEEGKNIAGHIFLSHTHWDHIQGIPFFKPGFVKGNSFTIYAARDEENRLNEVLAGQMEYRYFPVKLEDMGAHISFRELKEGEVISIGTATISTSPLIHTSKTLGYRIEAEGRSIAYCTDSEPYYHSFAKESEMAREEIHCAELGRTVKGAPDLSSLEIARDVDLLIHDSQYDDDEYLEKVGWGHSSAMQALSIALMANCKMLALFHYDPNYSDEKIDLMVKRCKEVVSRMGRDLLVFGAAEGMEIEIGD